MKATEVAIERRITVFVVLAIIVIMGLYSYATLPRESEPEIVIPAAIVMVTYQGVSPMDMETLVTSPIERKLTGISGIKKMTSTSGEGLSTIVVEFEAGVDVDEAIQKVRDKVSLAESDLPDEADDPSIRDINVAEQPIIFANLTGPVSVAELTRVAEELEEKLETISGVLDVDILGKTEREIQIVVDPIRAGLYGVPMTELLRIAQVENVNTPAGSMDVGEAKYLMRVPGEFQSVEDLQNLVVKRSETGVVYLRDLAVVRDGFKKVTGYSRLGMEPSVSLIVTKRAGINIIKLSDEVKAMLEEARASVPPAISMDITLDESVRIDQMVQQLEDSILTGLILVVAVIFIFLGFANALFVALAIPISLLITFVVMMITGMTLNMVSLFSLMVALGMLVDNGIVVVENIYRHAQTGLSRVEAAKKGAAEVAWPVFGSTLTTIAAFFPLIFWPGIMGKFMSLLPKTVILTLLASLFVGLIVNPALASVFVKTSDARVGAEKDEKRYGRLMDAYGNLLRLTLRWRMVTITLAISLLISTIGIYSTNFRYEFLAESEPDRAYLNIELAEGASIDSTDVIAREMEALLGDEMPNLDFLLTNVGSRGASVREGTGPSNMGPGAGASHLGRISLVFPDFDQKKDLPSNIIRRVRSLFDGLLGAEVRITQTSMGPGSGAPINIELTGDDFDILEQLAREIEAIIKEIPGLVDLQDNLERGKPEVRILVDRQQATLANLNTQYIGLIVQTAVHGRKAAEYREGDDEYDVTVMFPPKFQEDLSNLEGMGITNPQGTQIPFSSVARLEHGAGLGVIKRIDRKRTVTIEAEAEERLGSEVLADVQNALADFPLPAGYAIMYTGENEEVTESGNFMVRAFFVALCLIALVLITQFNSIIQPTIIMSSVILSFGGVFFGLWVFDMPFGVLMSGIGCIILAGIVVNNAIVLVDFINNLREEGVPLEEAIITAGKTRFRPVMLTAVTTILGLLPLGLGIRFDFRSFELDVGGSQAAYWSAMAVAIIFGLTFATILTLVIVPTLYSVADSFQQLVTRKPRTTGSDVPIDVVAK